MKYQFNPFEEFFPGNVDCYELIKDNGDWMQSESEWEEVTGRYEGKWNGEKGF